MRAEKPEKMVPETQTLELIDELKTRKNGDDMSWDGFKHILGSYPGIKTTRPSSTTISTSMKRTLSGVQRLSLSRFESSSRRSSMASMTQVCERRRPLSERYDFARSSR